MSSKAAKRKQDFLKREARRQQEEKRRQAIRNAKGIEELAAAMEIKLQ